MSYMTVSEITHYECMNECDLSDAITETVAGALNKIKF